MKRAIATITLGLGLVADDGDGAGYDAPTFDLSSPDMVSAEMTRAEVEAVLAATTGTAPPISLESGCRASTFPVSTFLA